MPCSACGANTEPSQPFCSACGADLRPAPLPAPPAQPEPPDTSQGWHAGRDDQASGWKGGPYTWEQLVTYAREGRITPGDLVWHESLPDWIPAGSVPGLFAPVAPQPVAAVPVAPQPTETAAPTQQTAPPAPVPAPVANVPGVAPAPAKSPRTGLIIGIVVGILVLLLAGGGAWWAWSSGLLGGKGPTLGVAQTRLPSAAKLVKTEAFGEVPVNQIGVSLREGASRSDAEKIATRLGGSIVGEVAYISLYQIEFPGESEADLRKALEAAKADSTVEFAFPNQQVVDDVDIKGVRIDPYDDPTYGNGAGDGYKAIGVTKAWSYIKGSGIPLSDAHVGIVDTGIYAPEDGKEGEFGGDVQVDYPDPAAGKVNIPEVYDDGSVNGAGTHGTGVATIIGADPDNGGPSGIAGPLGKKLKMSLINKNSGQYGSWTTSTPDPNDPTKIAWGNGHSYTIGTLVALTKQVDNGARVINCSWGNADADVQTAAAYKKFFEKMATDHPDVTFVCSGGNTGTALDGEHRFPSGLKLPNMITVGALDNDGKLATYSSQSSANYEITLGAPGTQAVVGIGEGDGTGPVRQDGTSFAAPHVTAAVAILQSINPKLTAAQIKEILVSTARDGVTVGEPGEAGAKTNLISDKVGGKVLALDEAVLKVINDLRAAKQPPLPPLDAALLEKLGVIDAIASTGDPSEYAVRGIVGATGEQGTQVEIDVSAEDFGIGGNTVQTLQGAGEANWSVTLSKDEGVITVTRLDNGAGSRITIEKFDLNGMWSGTFTVTNVTITDQEAAKKEGCSAAILNAIKGKALPATMNITADKDGQGSSVFKIDASSLSKDGKSSSKPVNFGVSYAGGTVTFDPQGGGSGISGMTATVKRSGTNLAMTGVMSASGKGWTMTAAVKLTKPAE